MIHLDLRGLNGAGPRIVKKAADQRGPAIMALADIGEFEDAKNLLAMGADVVSLRGADPEFAEWLSRSDEGVRLLERLVQCAQAHLRGRRLTWPGFLLSAGQTLCSDGRSEEGRDDARRVCGEEALSCQGNALGEGRWHLFWQSRVVLQDQQALLSQRCSIGQNGTVRKGVYGTKKESGRELAQRSWPRRS